MGRPHKARSHKAAGIKKRPSEPFYSADILSDTQYQLCSDIGRGIWGQALFHILHNDSDRLENNFAALIKLWNSTPARANQAIMEFINQRPCEVLINGKPMSRPVTECHLKNTDVVTLINRRRTRQLKERKQARLRKRKQRKLKRSQDVTEDVTPSKVSPSFSLSFSLSESSLEELSPSERERIFIKPFQYLRCCQKLRSLTSEQYNAAIIGRHTLMNFSIAAQITIRAANMNGVINNPGSFVHKCFGNYEKETKTHIRTQESWHRRRDKECTELAEYLSELPDSENGRVQEMKTEYEKKWGKDFIVEAERRRQQ